MANKLKVLIWLHRSKMNAGGKAPLMLRLSYRSHRQDKATGFYVAPELWNPDRQQMKGSGPEAHKINEYLIKVNARARKLFEAAVDADDVDLRSLVCELFSGPKVERTLLQTIKEFNEDLRERVGKDYTASTFEKYLFTADKVKAFMVSRRIKDIRLKDLSASFMVDFDHYLRTAEGNQHNTAVKYCLNLKRIINVAVLKGYLPTNTLNAHKTVYKDTQQVYLDETEVGKLRSLKLPKNKYELALDLFLFQANTGVAYTDLCQLRPEDITETDGAKWIIKARQKTDIVAIIPILPEAEGLTIKYQHHPKRSGTLFPSISIQKYNQYLSELGELAGLSKRISSHVGRRTFGNIALGRGISLNVISKVLGHSNTLVTQRIYAITTQRIVQAEMQKW
jgi:integrase